MSDKTDPPAPEFTSVPVMLEDEMRRSYLDYAMSVIVSRALPDARDGLKPVHRRILFSMSESGYTPDKPHRKSARVVGDVIGKYHPHGDLAIYDALVRMAQTFSLRAPLIDGQGNFGSVDGDQPAAMRYTEVRLSRSAMLLLEDIDKDTVDFSPNYDETEEEPRVLPARFPNLLINGGSGIAVGMATNIPPHNPVEIMDALLHLIEEPDATLDDLMRIVPGPDFPTAGLLIGRSGIRSAFETGRGSLVMRAKAEFEDMRGGRTAIIVTELPYQVNKATLQEKTAELIRAKSIEGISDIRDESDRSGMRIVYELKRESTPEVVLNHLYRMTQLQTSFGVNFMALDGGRPRLMGLKDALTTFMAFREDVILRRSRHLLSKARDRAHLLVGLAIAVANIDEVIRLIRASPDTATARAALMGRNWPADEILPLLALIDDRANKVIEGQVRLTEAQARGILDLRLARLTALEREKIDAEMGEVAGEITELLKVLDSRPRRLEVMREEFLAVREALKSPRLTQIVDAVADQDDESLVEPGQMVVTITRDGFIKRTPLETYRQQNRGGRGRTGAGTRGDDIVTRSFNAHTHQWVLFFSSGGKAYREKIWRLPEASPTSRGRALVNLLPDLGGDGITTVLPLPQDEALWDGLHLVFATASGNVRRNRLSDFGRIRSSGIIAMKLDEGDHLIGVATCHEGDDVFLATRLGRCIRFQITDDTLRVFSGRDSQGVRGIRLLRDDEVIGLSILRHVDWQGDTPADRAAERTAAMKAANARRRLRGEQVDASAETDAEEDEVSAAGPMSPEREEELSGLEQILLTVTDAGFGKRSSAFGYRVTGRGGVGISNMTLTARTGHSIVASFPVHPDDGLMLVTDGGQLIRTPADQVRVTGRASMGVRVLRVADGERVTSVFPVLESPDSSDDTVDEMPPPDGLAGGVPDETDG